VIFMYDTPDLSPHRVVNVRIDRVGPSVDRQVHQIAPFAGPHNRDQPMSTSAALLLPDPAELADPPAGDPILRGPQQVVVRSLAEHRRAKFRAEIRVVPAAEPAVEATTRPLPSSPGQPEVTRLMRLVLEVLDRRRPQSHLENWVPISDFRALIRDDRVGPRRLRSVRSSTPMPGVLEVCATFDVEQRARAMVGRFEFSGQEWRCTLLRML
jgi:hypothetical protein